MHSVGGEGTGRYMPQFHREFCEHNYQSHRLVHSGKAVKMTWRQACNITAMIFREVQHQSVHMVYWLQAIECVQSRT